MKHRNVLVLLCDFDVYHPCTALEKLKLSRSRPIERQYDYTEYQKELLEKGGKCTGGFPLFKRRFQSEERNQD